MGETTVRRNDPEAQPEDSPEVQVEYDLHSAYVSLKRLATAGILPWKLEMALEYAARALKGCAVCGQSLGFLHGQACVSHRGHHVNEHDLVSDLEDKPQSPINPF